MMSDQINWVKKEMPVQADDQSRSCVLNVCLNAPYNLSVQDSWVLGWVLSLITAVTFPPWTFF